MSRIVAAEYVTADGVMQDPGGVGEIELGGWSNPYWNDELEKFQTGLLFASDALLLGRITYEGFAAAWPDPEHEEGGFATKMNTMPKYVASRTLTDTEWNATLIKGDVPEEVTRLKQQSGQNLLLYGSGALMNTLLPHDLIDQYRLMIYPWSWDTANDCSGNRGTGSCSASSTPTRPAPASSSRTTSRQQTRPDRNRRRSRPPKGAPLHLDGGHHPHARRPRRPSPPLRHSPTVVPRRLRPSGGHRAAAPAHTTAMDGRRDLGPQLRRPLRRLQSAHRARGRAPPAARDVRGHHPLVGRRRTPQPARIRAGARGKQREQEHDRARTRTQMTAPQKGPPVRARAANRGRPPRPMDSGPGRVIYRRHVREPGSRNLPGCP
jgi:dihydrofolate reductase